MRTTKEAKILNSALNKRLLNYMATAGAAGIGVLTITQPANAEVVYTPAHRVIEFDRSGLDFYQI